MPDFYGQVLAGSYMRFNVLIPLTIYSGITANHPLNNHQNQSGSHA